MEIYLTETLIYMRRREKELPHYGGKSPQVTKRRLLVDWTCTRGEKLSLPKSAIHLAIVLIDRFMDGHDIAEPSLYLVCLAALSIAAKFDCVESKVPKIAKFKKLLDDPASCPATEFQKLEYMIFSFFKWNIFIPTPTHFVELLLDQVLHPTDLVAGKSIHNNYGDVLDCLTDFIYYFLAVSMQVIHVSANQGIHSSSFILF
jgi:hypothetical protein